MSDWFWAGLWGGIGYALSGLLLVTGFFAALVIYACIRVLLAWLHIWRWR